MEGERWGSGKDKEIDERGREGRWVGEGEEKREGDTEA